MLLLSQPTKQLGLQLMITFIIEQYVDYNGIICFTYKMSENSQKCWSQFHFKQSRYSINNDIKTEKISKSTYLRGAVIGQCLAF